MEQGSILIAFVFTLIAGLSTGIGSVIALIAKRTNTKFLCFSLGLSAGVMLYVSFMEMMPGARVALAEAFGEKTGMLYMIIAFFGGMGLITLIDLLVPESGNPHEMHGVEEMDKKDALHRSGLIVAVSLALHNFPEGIATFSSALTGMDVAVPITVAVAIHNIPEGIAVSVPIYHATGSKLKAFWYSFLSGFAEPVGALMAYFFLMQYQTPAINGMVLAAVAGIMVFVSLDELLPTAEKYGKHHVSISGVVVGMLTMGLSLFMFV